MPTTTAASLRNAYRLSGEPHGAPYAWPMAAAIENASVGVMLDTTDDAYCLLIDSVIDRVTSLGSCEHRIVSLACAVTTFADMTPEKSPVPATRTHGLGAIVAVRFKSLIAPFVLTVPASCPA